MLVRRQLLASVTSSFPPLPRPLTSSPPPSAFLSETLPDGNVFIPLTSLPSPLCFFSFPLVFFLPLNYIFPSRCLNTFLLPHHFPLSSALCPLTCFPFALHLPIPSSSHLPLLLSFSPSSHLSPLPSPSHLLLAFLSSLSDVPPNPHPHPNLTSTSSLHL